MTTKKEDITLHISRATHTRLTQANIWGESLADTLDRLLGITASNHNKKGEKK